MSTLKQSLIELNEINEELEKIHAPGYVSPDAKAFLASDDFKILKQSILDDFRAELNKIF